MNLEKYNALEEVRMSNPKGLLVPAEVVEAARNKKSPLHEEFTWHDGEAAAKYREQEARQVIRAAIVFEPRLQRKTRAYISVPTDRDGGAGYRSTSEVVTNDDYVSQLTEEVRNKLHSMRSAYSHLKPLDALWSRIDDVVETFLASRQSNAA